MAFVERQINVSFSLESAAAGVSSVEGRRVSCKIVNAGAPSMATADVVIYGLPLSTMNQLSTVGTQLNLIGKNSITIEAGDEQSGMGTVFKGTITLAYVDAQSQPEVAFRVSALAGLESAVKATDPTSVKGSADVVQTAQQIAQQAGLQFEGNSVSAKISNPYLPGSAREQIMRLCQAAGVQWTIENDTLAIWKADQPRQGDAVQLSPQTGMVGYPAFNQAGVVVRTIFNKALKFGGKINVQSQLTPACGDWMVTNLCHDLESQTPNGQWFSVIEAVRTGGTQVVGGDGN